MDDTVVADDAADSVVEDTAAAEADISDREVGGEEGDEKFISQRELDRILQSRVDRANKSAEKKYSKQIEELASKIAAYEDEKLSAEEKKDKRLSELEQSLNEATERYTRLERTRLVETLAREMGLPEKFWSRVQGTTDDEIISDINDMLEGLPKDKGNGSIPSQTPKVSVQATNSEPEVEENPKAIVDKLGSMFSF